jgi:hypothetical protein
VTRTATPAERRWILLALGVVVAVAGILVLSAPSGRDGNSSQGPSWVEGTGFGQEEEGARVFDTGSLELRDQEDHLDHEALLPGVTLCVWRTRSGAISRPGLITVRKSRVDYTLGGAAALRKFVRPIRDVQGARAMSFLLRAVFPGDPRFPPVLVGVGEGRPGRGRPQLSTLPRVRSHSLPATSRSNGSS